MADRRIASLRAPGRQRGAGLLLALLLLCAGGHAAAQAAPREAPYPAQPPAAPPPGYGAQPAPVYSPLDPNAAPPPPGYGAQPAPGYGAPPPGYGAPSAVPPPAPGYGAAPPAYGAPPPAYAPGAPGAPVVPQLTIAAPRLAAGLPDWRSGRLLSGFGAAVDLVGSGLSVSGIVLLGLGYPDHGSALTLAGTAGHTLGFVLSATGLGLQHRALQTIGLPDNRGLFGVGTAFGIAGLVGTGAGIFFAATDYLKDSPGSADRSIAIAVAALGGSVLYLIGGILYQVDSLRMKAVMARLGRF